MQTEAMDREIRLNIALGEIARIVLNEGSIENVAQIVLQKAKELTDSEFGVVCYMDYSSGHLARSQQTPSCHVVEDCPAWQEIKGLLAWVSLHSQALLSNNHHDVPSSYEELIGTLPIRRFLAIPVLDGENLIGLIFVANARRDYDTADIMSLQQIAELCARAVVRHSENTKLRLFRGLIDQSNDAIYVIDVQTSRFIETNEAASLFLGYGREEFLSLGVIDISATHPDLASWQQSIEFLRTVPYHVFEGEQIHKDGSRLPVEVNVRLLRHEGNEYILSVARDIRDRKRAADALVEEKNKLEAVLTSLGDGVTVQDRQFKILYQNKIHKAKQGDHKGELCYHAYQGLDTICKGCLLVRCFEDGNTHRRETSATTPEGKTIYLEVSASPVRDAQGNIYAGIETVRDITSRKLLEQELVKRQKLESVGVLAGGIAHDFNNMLTAILGNVSLASLKLPRDSESQQLLSSAERACSRAKNLTQQLLTFSKGGAPVTQTASISSLIAESATFTLRGSKARCVVGPIPEDLWPVDVDEGQIDQVIQNLVKNAEQAMPQGGSVYVSAENIEVLDNVIPSLREGKYIKITIKDEGVGISPSMLENIFDPYFTTKTSGSGLGLAVCYSIIVNHRGIITVESSERVGTAFSIFLPASDKELIPVEAVTEVIQKEKRGARILLMDDDEMVQKVCVHLLEHLGYQVASAFDGETAVSLFQVAKEGGVAFDAVILDLTVPGGMGGLETLSKLLEIDSTVKAIVSSGYANDPIMSDYKKYGFAAIIPKPFTLDDLRKKLDLID